LVVGINFTIGFTAGAGVFLVAVAGVFFVADLGAGCGTEVLPFGAGLLATDAGAFFALFALFAVAVALAGAVALLTEDFAVATLAGATLAGATLAGATLEGLALGGVALGGVALEEDVFLIGAGVIFFTLVVCGLAADFTAGLKALYAATFAGALPLTRFDFALAFEPGDERTFLDVLIPCAGFLATGAGFGFEAVFPFEAVAATTGFRALLGWSDFPGFALAWDTAFAWLTFPSDLADLDWGIMEFDPVCCCGLGWFKGKVGLWG